MNIDRLGGVICAGNIVYDILVRPVDAIVWNTTRWVDSIEWHMGGNGASTAYALGVLGTPVKLLSAVGRDPFAEELLARLHQAGVDTSGVARFDSSTATSIALVSEAGDRFLLHQAGSSADAFPEAVEFSPALREGATHFHLGNAFALPNLRKHAAESLRRAKAAGLTTSVDTGWDSRNRWLADLGASLPYTDLLFVNEDEALRLSGEGDHKAAASRLRQLGAAAVVVKRGGQGCAVFAGEETDAPAFDVAAVDTTGAGDCFAGGFLAALHRGFAYPDAARFANAVAGLSVQRLGATAGLLPYEETLAWMSARA